MVDQTMRYAQALGTDTLTTSIPLVDISILPWETCITSSTNPYMVKRGKTTGVILNPDF